jgi:hypothetical protein
MYVTVIATLCKLIVPLATIAPNADCTAEEARVEEIVTDSTVDEFADFFGCMVQGQIGAAKWKSENPLYHGDRWRIARIKCVPGRYEPAGRA